MENGEKLDLLKIIEKEASLIINEIESEHSKITVLRSEIDEYGTMVLTLQGGINGRGKWSEYLKDLGKIVEEIEHRLQYKMWLLRLENDSLDDIFYAKFGIK